MAKRDSRLKGINPLSYLGINAYSPPNITEHDRAPTTDDNKNIYIGDLWIDASSTPKDVHMLVSLDAGTATWLLISSSFDGTVTDHAVMVGDGTNSIKSIAVGATGEMLVGVTGADPEYIIAGDTGEMLVGVTGASPEFSTSLDGGFEFIDASITSIDVAITNLSDTSTNADAVLELTTTSATGGDPKIGFNVSGEQIFTIGIDNADSDKFKICASTMGVSEALVIEPVAFGVELPVSLTLSAEGEGVLRAEAGGLVFSSKGTDGQVLISSTAGVPAWQTLNYETDSGTATVSNAGVTKILGGTNVNVSASGNAITVDAGLATYFENLASDPTSPDEGQVWYNTTTELFKGSKGTGANAWVSKALPPFQNTDAMYGACGDSEDALVSVSSGTIAYETLLYESHTDSFSYRQTQSTLNGGGAFVGDDVNDGLAFGGFNSGSPTALTEQYDGFLDSWESKTSMNQARRYFGGCGTTSDALACGGIIDLIVTLTNTTERYDGVGDSWANKAVISSSRSSNGSAGDGADALTFGGDAGAGSLTVVERYDGTGDSWTNKAVLSAIRISISGASTAADALAVGGYSTFPTTVAIVEIYDGGLDSWSAGPNLNAARAAVGASGDSSTSAIAIDVRAAASLPTEKLEDGATIVTFTVT